MIAQSAAQQLNYWWKRPLYPVCRSSGIAKLRICTRLPLPPKRLREACPLHRILTSTGRCLLQHMSRYVQPVKRQSPLSTPPHTRLPDRTKAHQEATLLATLSHPNIVGFWESFLHGSLRDILCIVMDYADGGDLSSCLRARNRRLIEEETILNW